MGCLESCQPAEVLVFFCLDVGDKGKGWSLAEWGEEWDKEGRVSVDRVSHWGLAKKKEGGGGMRVARSENGEEKEG